MNFINAVRLTEIFLAIVIIQQSLEHIKSLEPNLKIFLPRLTLAVLLLIGYQTSYILAGLVVLAIVSLVRFQGPYNGGADRMGVLILLCLFAVHFSATQYWQEVAFGYLGIQLVFSYFFSGWVKIKNPQWWTGRALADVFQYSNYPVSESLRQWASYPRVLFIASWLVILFELLFPISLLTKPSLVIALVAAALFHLSNACFFGLNRFFWVWLAAYPSILWLQQRLMMVNI